MRKKRNAVSVSEGTLSSVKTAIVVWWLDVGSFSAEPEPLATVWCREEQICRTEVDGKDLVGVGRTLLYLYSGYMGSMASCS